MFEIDELDRKIIVATQGGIPISIEPYKDVAKELEITEELLLKRLEILKDEGVVRRVALVPNHYKLGYTFNGMTVWQVKDESCNKVGEAFAALPFVSHCYKRKKYPGLWDYNIFAMIHGKNERECDEYLLQMKEICKEDLIVMETLYSSQILKKTGLRIKDR